MEEESLKQLKAKYEMLLKKMNEFDAIYSEFAQDSMNRGKGCFGYIKERPDLEYGRIAKQSLQAALSSLYLIIRGKENDRGECDKRCIGCSALHWNFDNDGWSCQVVCECK